jgi:uncharacterized protein (DUF1015 family)
MPPNPPATATGLSLAPFRGLRFRADGAELAGLVSPPYDVVDPDARAALLEQDERNIVAIILPERATATSSAGLDGGGPDYAGAAILLRTQTEDGVLQVDAAPALYVYEMRTPEGHLTRGLIGAVLLHDPADGVIFPHENTMSGPVSDRLALMEATRANLEPIYLVYDGGGPASESVAEAAAGTPIAATTTPDGVRHRLWAITDPVALTAIDADLSTRTAVIADGHHRYATYLELQRRSHRDAGAGAWDRGLTMLVDSLEFGPVVEAIHRVVPGLTMQEAISAAAGSFAVTALDQARGSTQGDALLSRLPSGAGFAVVITDGRLAAVLTDPEPRVLRAGFGSSLGGPVESLDVSVVHEILVKTVWGLSDDAASLGYAHSADEAIAEAVAHDGVAILLRPTPVDAVLSIARQGLRMPRKSTLFLPKPASGMVLRRFEDQTGG